ncbi:MAG: hypothetical protein H6985_06535 [Pseudomonadales bacterium]|nr:hypothetical protein [Halioglobus sp.]MCP5129221.1 hypothetical protein [Pseudomonadales bacterium]
MTPFDLAQSRIITETTKLRAAVEAENDPFHKAINIATLLQSLDLDGNPDNGIEIPEQMHQFLEGVELELGQHWSSFQRDFTLRKIIASAVTQQVFAEPRGVVSPALALQHLYNNLGADSAVKGISRVTSQNSITEYKYDSNGFVTELIETGSDSLVPYEHHRWRYSNRGQMTAAATPGYFPAPDGTEYFQYQWRYDTAGNLLREEYRFQAEAIPYFCTAFEYDVNGSPTHAKGCPEYSAAVQPRYYRKFEHDPQGLLDRDTWHDSDGNQCTEYRYTYDSRGNQTARITQTNPACASWTQVNTVERWLYNEEGQIIQREYDSNGDGTVEDRNNWEFDSQGNLLRELVSHPEASPPIVNSLVTSYEYDAQGRKVRHTAHIWSPGGLLSTQWEYSGNTVVRSATYDDFDGFGGLQRTFSSYDDSGNPIEYRTDIEGDGNWDSVSRLEYDSDQNLLRSEHDQDNDGLIDSTVTYEYQSTGMGHIFTTLEPEKTSFIYETQTVR